MAGVTRKQAKELVLAAWADDEWWRAEPIAIGVTTEVGDAWLIEVVLKANADGDEGAIMFDSPTALVSQHVTGRSARSTGSRRWRGTGGRKG